MSTRLKFSISMILFGIFVFTFTVGLSSWFHEKYLFTLSALPKSPEIKEEHFAVDMIGNPPMTSVNALKLKVPDKGAYLGVDTGMLNDGLPRFEKMAGKRFAAINVYVYWGEKKANFDELLASRLWLQNKIMVVTWNPSKSLLSNPVDQPNFLFDQIQSGRYDGYINNWVAAVKKWHRPVVIRFAPEMNGNWLPWGDTFTTPAEYIKTYQYVVNFFKRDNVDNVTWMWSPNEADKVDLIDYYPGDAYVDWIGLSGFNWGGLNPINKWRPLDQIFKKSLDELTPINKPIALAEFGSVESKTDPQAKAKWMLDSFSMLKQKYPQIKMIIWVNGTSFSIYDWRVNTSSYSLDAFKQAISDDYFLDKAEFKRK